MASGGRQSLRMLRALLASRSPQCQFLDRASSDLSGGGFSRLFGRTTASRGIQTNAEENSENPKPQELDASYNSAEISLHPQSEDTDPSKTKFSAKSSLKVSSRHDLAMIFTCKVCETRSVKTASRESYEKGVVVARCSGCNNLHLIADRLGWFGTPGSVEDFLAARGEEVKKGSADTLNLTLEELAGLKS